MSFALCLLALVLLTAALHPFTSYPASLWLLAKLRGRTQAAPRPAPYQPASFSLLTSAYNEEASIQAFAANRLAVAGMRPAEILVYDDGSSDRTRDWLSAYGDRITLVEGQGRQGKTHGMNMLAQRATGDILVFTDANVTLASDVLDRLAFHFRDPMVGCVCGHLTYVNPDASATASTGSFYWRLEEKIKALESELGSTMGADGSLFAIRRTVHRPVPEHLIDDMYLSLSILLDGYRVISVPDVQAFERSATGARDEFRRKARIACQALNVHRVLTPRLASLSALDRYKYFSHKWLRWLTPFTGLAGLASLALAALLSPWASGLMTLALAGAAAGCFLFAYRRLLREKIVSILLAFAGVGLGVIQSARGELYRTWTPAASVR